MGSWGRGLDPDRVVWGLIGANVLGFLLWRVSPQQVCLLAPTPGWRCRWSRAASLTHCPLLSMCALLLPLSAAHACDHPPIALQMSKHATVSIESLRSGRLWTAVTNAFSHAALGHLGANMIGL